MDNSRDVTHVLNCSICEKQVKTANEPLTTHLMFAETVLSGTQSADLSDMFDCVRISYTYISC